MTDALTDLGRFADPSLLILTSLAAGDRHGYAMIEDIRSLTGVTLGPGTLYGALTRLERRGMIEALPSADRRRPYRLTPPGRDALTASLRTLDRIARVGLHRLGEAT